MSEPSSFFGTLRQQAQNSIWFTLLFTVLLVFNMMLIFFPLMMAVVAAIYGLNLGDLSLLVSASAPISEEGLQIFRLIQGLQQMLVWFLPAILMAWLLGNPARQLSWQWPQEKGTTAILLAIITILVSLPLVSSVLIPADSFSLPDFLSGIESWILEQEKQVIRQLEQVLSSGDSKDLWPNILVFAVLPGLLEELFFRGFLQGQIQKYWGGHWGVWLTAVIFSTIHFQFLGFFSRLLLGAMLGYFVLWSGSLFPAILAHFAFNLTSVLAAHFSWEALDDGGQLPLETFSGLTVTISGIATLLLLFLYFRIFRGASEPPNYAE